MGESKGDTFCKQMRAATREIHAVSDALVNAKLAFGLQDDKVWADGLLVFYEIFKYLEKAMPGVTKKHEIDNIIPQDMERTKAFEEDLNFYLGSEWSKNYTPRESVVQYLNHLKELECTKPILLLAYVYHLYMGLLSGGIILRKKRQLIQKLSPFKSTHKLEGNHVTDFGESSIYKLKENFRRKMNELAEGLDELTKEQLIEESKVVFVMNNQIIRSVQGASAVMIKKIIYVITILLVLILFYIFKR
ncbi:heme oxygenase [Fopius arisanus]|uniref:Heme oxygenase n=1 Tax=Fopius arisanus TaxID=64838 RepID=A0A9R1SXW7_9HYME|nr:PREDICTED: heme oxygenase [Fopius arisanus]